MAMSSSTVNKKNGKPKYTAAQKPANQVGRGSLSLYPMTVWALRFSRNFLSMDLRFNFASKVVPQ
jgi:hypothetical protein